MERSRQKILREPQPARERSFRTLPSGDVRVTGSGTCRVGGEFAVQQQLSLDLKVGDDPVQHFDSGLVAGGGDFPRINITISIHGQYCFDTVFGLDASPVPPAEVQVYKLLPESTYQQGCTGPCACAPGPLQRIRRTLSLVALDRGPLFAHYAVATANWQVSADNATGSSGAAVVGSGFYRVGGEVAVEQQMSLELKVGTQAPMSFDSGLVPGGGAFPRIDIRVPSRSPATVGRLCGCLRPATSCPASSSAIHPAFS